MKFNLFKVKPIQAPVANVTAKRKILADIQKLLPHVEGQTFIERVKFSKFNAKALTDHQVNSIFNHIQNSFKK